MHSSLVRSLRLNLNNLQSTHNDKNTSLAIQHGATKSSSQQITLNPDQSSCKSTIPPRTVDAVDEKPISATARIISTKFKSIALGIHVKLKELMEKHQSEQYRNIFLVNHCLEVLEEMGRLFIVFEDVTQSLKTVFSHAIFSDKFTAVSDVTGTHSLVHQIPFYDFCLQKQKLLFLAESQEKSMKDLYIIQQKEEAFTELKKEYKEEIAFSRLLKNENLRLKTQMDEIIRTLEKERRSSEKKLREVTYKYDIAKTMIRKLKRDVKQLRERMNNINSVNRDSFILKKTRQDHVIDMFSKGTEITTLNTLCQQLEIVENYRLNGYSSGISGVLSGKKSELKSEYVNDVNLLINEMKMLQEKKKELAVQGKSVYVPFNRSTITNKLIAPLRDLDGIKFRSYIELFVSRDNLQSFELLERKSITPQTEPSTLPIPSGVTHIRFLHSKYNYTEPHPLIGRTHEMIENSEEDVVNEITHLSEYIQTPELWKIYLSRFNDRFPSVPRIVSVFQLRQIIYLTYERHSRVLSKEKKSLKSVPSLFDVLFSVIKGLYVLPEVVMKVLFEILLSIEQHKKHYADVLEFSMCTSPRDTALGRCLSIVLSLLRALWLTMCDDYSHTLNRTDVEKLIKYFYPTLTEEERNRTHSLILGTELKSPSKNMYSIERINKAFITGFLDATEHWCQRADQTLQDLYLREMISLDEYVRFMHEDLPYIPLDELSTRFQEACNCQSSRTHLHYKNVAYIYAEYRWVDCSARLRQQLQIELTPEL